MRINVTPRHIKASLSRNGQVSPIEYAIMDQDCFEEVSITMKSEQVYRLMVDGEVMDLPAKVNKALNKFSATGEMEPFSFNLALESQSMIYEDFSMDVFDSIYDY